MDEFDSLEDEFEEESLLETLLLEEESLVEDGLSLDVSLVDGSTDVSLVVDGSVDSVDVLVLVGT